MYSVLRKFGVEAMLQAGIERLLFVNGLVHGAEIGMLNLLIEKLAYTTHFTCSSRAPEIARPWADFD